MPALPGSPPIARLVGAALNERATPPFVDDDVRSVMDSLLL